MVAGVPMEAVGLNLIVSATVFLAAHSPVYLLIAPVLGLSAGLCVLVALGGVAGGLLARVPVPSHREHPETSVY